MIAGKAGVCSAVLNVSVACFGKFVTLSKNPRMSTALPSTFEIGKGVIGDLECF